MYEGTIKRVVADRGFGFISVPNQPDVFFHINDIDPDLEFDERLTERRVRFGIVSSPKGPRAVGVAAV